MFVTAKGLRVLNPAQSTQSLFKICTLIPLLYSQQNYLSHKYIYITFYLKLVILDIFLLFFYQHVRNVMKQIFNETCCYFIIHISNKNKK